MKRTPIEITDALRSKWLHTRHAPIERSFIGDRSPILKGMEIKQTSPLALSLGFSPMFFEGYLWIRVINFEQTDIYITTVKSIKPGEGNFSKLVAKILDDGFICKVPLPNQEMQQILKHLGFARTIEQDDVFNEDVEVWVKHPYQ